MKQGERDAQRITVEKKACSEGDRIFALYGSRLSF